MPRKLMRTMSSSSAILGSSTVEARQIPAHGIRMSAGPVVATIRTTASCTCSRWRTSAAAVAQRAPFFRSSLANASSPVVSRSIRPTLAPRCANNRPSSSPMPLAAPLMTTTCSVDRILCHSSQCRGHLQLSHDWKPELKHQNRPPQSQEILAFPPCFGHCSDIDSAIGQVDDSAIGQVDLANKSPAHFCSAVRW